MIENILAGLLPLVLTFSCPQSIPILLLSLTPVVVVTTVLPRGKRGDADPSKATLDFCQKTEVTFKGPLEALIGLLSVRTLHAGSLALRTPPGEIVGLDAFMS